MSLVHHALGASLTLIVVPAFATAAVFTDNFDSGVSGSVWEPVPGTNIQILVGDNAHAFGTQSAKQVDADPFIYYMRNKAGSISTTAVGAGQKEVLTVYMWDDDQFHNGHPTNQPVGAGVMLATTDLGDFYQININFGIAGGYSTYNWRTSGQGTFSTGVARSQGWHNFQIEVLPYTGTNDVKFYIDDALVGTGNRKAAQANSAFDQIRLGISFKTYAPFWYDNVDLSMVPEPISLFLLAPL